MESSVARYSSTLSTSTFSFAFSAAFSFVKRGVVLGQGVQELVHHGHIIAAHACFGEYMGGNFLRCQHMYFVRLSLEIKPVVFQFIDQIALDIHMVGGDDIGAVGHALDLAFSGIGHAGEEVHQAAGHIFVGGFGFMTTVRCS